MKLIHCTKCLDVIQLRSRRRTCICGRSGGRYTNHLNAEIWGRAIPVGISNDKFQVALRHRPPTGYGQPFEAFVIPVTCPTVTVIESPKPRKIKKKEVLNVT